MKKTLEEELAPERGSVTLACKDFSSIELDGPWLKEKWYGTEYMMQRLDSAILDKVSSASSHGHLSTIAMRSTN
jgi:hypothetical protein